MKESLPLVDLAGTAGTPPEGVDLATWLVAELPAGELDRAMRRQFPITPELLVQDKKRGGHLMKALTENPHPEIALVKDIDARQIELSKPRRRLAAAACFLALAAPATYGIDRAVTTVGEQMTAGTPGAHIERTHGARRVEDDLLVGIPAGALGGMLGAMVSLRLAGHLARRPAQQLVRRAQQPEQAV